ncbi:DUF6924 domain-containing protein [Actinacidiphila glaucinigra]|uniref:DUF6924 domain-containing protein n=1 Tax=Actinacidiphila glaucinigra TaxID=235986 RepID=UPI0035E1AF82
MESWDLRVFSRTDDRDVFDAVVIRTDYRDEQAWQIVKAALAKVSFEGVEYSPRAWIIDDPTWADASVDETLAAVAASEPLKGLEVLFIADKVTMHAAHHALMAVTTATRNEDGVINYDRAFRTVPEGIQSIHVNLELGSMGFEEFATVAHYDPEDVYRP